MEFKNLMEDVVFQVVDEILPRQGCCDCEKCRLDIAALALNHLPPRYVVTEKGKVLSKTAILRPQFEVDVLTAVLNAIEVVKNHPLHVRSGK